jgi:glycosyltransferase involved in cell wall biosynthesis
MMIVGMMRIKNEARWIERVLRSMLPACERIFILDDHSTDGTPELCATFSQVTLFRSEFQGLDETRDKNWLIAQVEAEVPSGSWVVAIDGDEELAPGGADAILRMTRDPNAYQNAFRFHIQYLWDSETQWRVDGIYRNFHRASMFRLKHGQRFFSNNGGGFHCGNVPEQFNCPRTDIRVLHYGYMNREDRIRKFEWYNAPDKQPIPEVEDGYRHMVIGDLFPVDMRARHGGPLQLEVLP